MGGGTRFMAIRFTILICIAAAAAPLHAQTPVADPPLTLTLEDALSRARKVAQQYQSAVIAAEIAHEDRVQAKAALLPTVNGFNQYIYTQGNGTPSGVFVANDGVHIYNDQAVVHGDVLSPGKR